MGGTMPARSAHPLGRVQPVGLAVERVVEEVGAARRHAEEREADDGVHQRGGVAQRTRGPRRGGTSGANVPQMRT